MVFVGTVSSTSLMEMLAGANVNARYLGVRPQLDAGTRLCLRHADGGGVPQPHLVVQTSVDLTPALALAHRRHCPVRRPRQTLRCLTTSAAPRSSHPRR